MFAARECLFKWSTHSADGRVTYFGSGLGVAYLRICSPTLLGIMTKLFLIFQLAVKAMQGKFASVAAETLEVALRCCTRTSLGCSSSTSLHCGDRLL